MNLRTVLKKGEHKHDTVTVAAKLLQPMLSRHTVQSYMHDLLQGKEHVKHLLEFAMLEYNQGIVENFYSLLLSYLPGQCSLLPRH